MSANTARGSKSGRDKKDDLDAEKRKADNGDGIDTTKKRKREQATENQPAPVRSARVKKSVERFQPAPTVTEKPPIEIPNGKGTPLGEIKAVADELERRKVDDDMKSLHRILFGRPTDPSGPRKIKQNLRLFNGLDLKDEKEEEVIKDKFGRYLQSGLKDLCDLFNLEKSGDKTGLIDRVVQFLKNPRDTGHVKRGEVKKAKLAEKRKKKAENASKKVVKGRKPSSKKSADDGEEDGEDDDDEDEEEDDDNNDDDEEDELAEDEQDVDTKPVITKSTLVKPAPTKKAPPKKSASKTANGNDSKSSSKNSVVNADEDPMEGVEENAKLPSDVEIVAQIQQIFKGADDIDSITAKKVRKQLGEHFKADFSQKKKFINNTISEQFVKFSKGK